LCEILIVGKFIGTERRMGVLGVEGTVYLLFNMYNNIWNDERLTGIENGESYTEW
jgi:hypothetical protein